MHIFQCNMCPRCDFQNIADLTTHIHSHFHQHPVKCRICAESYWDAISFVQHISKKHSEVASTVKCPLCNLRPISLPAFQTHLLEQHQLLGTSVSLATSNRLSKKLSAGSYKCLNCDRCFSNPCDLSVHSKSHFGSTVYECSVCNKSSLKKITLANHIKKVHGGLFAEGNYTLIDSALDSIPESKKVGTCRPNIFWLMAKTRDEQKNPLRRFRCSLCEFFFVKKSSLEIHYRRNHPGELEIVNDLLECEICPSNTVFASSEEYFTHLVEKHSAENPYKCGHCVEKSFGYELDLEHHIRVEHEKETSERIVGVQSSPGISCSLCPKLFADTETRDRHEMAHNAERPFSCVVCDKSFVHQTSLAKHRISHIEEKRFMCDMCGKSFRVRTTLNVYKLYI